VARNALVMEAISESILPEDLDVFDLSLRQLHATGEPRGCELRMWRADGTHFWAHLDFAVGRGAKGESVCRLVVGDITEHRRMEAESRQFQKAESLNRMAGAIAHLFNNQMQAVMVSLDLLGELPPGADPAKYLAMGKRASERAAEVSQLMLVYLGQSAGNREARLLAELCRDCLSHLQSSLPKTVMLEADLPSPGPLVLANTEQVQQVLLNLVANARESLGDDPGSIRLSLRTWAGADIPSTHRFPIGWKPQEPEYACLEVADTGCGILAADIEKLFDPFFSTKFTGRGMGLPVVLGILQAHGAAVTVESRPGQGTVFRAYFPLAPETEQGSSASPG
jgi:two-component system cell cycle sensor histidine kinase/response regulator CckA